MSLVTKSMTYSSDKFDYEIDFLTLQRNLSLESNFVSKLLTRQISGVASTMQKVDCGIPQGSNLGPLLCLLYINDLTKCIKKCKVSLYADDTCIYVPDKDPCTVVNTLNNELKSVDKWLTKNKLALNAKKCEFLLLGSRKRIKDAVVPDVTIRARKLQRVIAYDT